MTTDAIPQSPLAPHEANRLLRAFSGGIENSAAYSFQFKQTPQKTDMFIYTYNGGHHIIEVGTKSVCHTMRHGISEIKTVLAAGKDASPGTIQITRQQRDFDFAKSELGEPVNVPIEDLIQTNHDLMHMAHVAIRTAQVIQNKRSQQGQGRG